MMEPIEDTDADGILEWYAGKTLFITGATGFMGKVLIEKLLRSIPDLKRIYILCRQKKGFSAHARIGDLINLPVFDRLRKERGNEIFSKLTAIEGDLEKENLGLRQDDKNLLINEVNIVVNGAADVRLGTDMRTAIEHNTVGTKRILDLSCEIKNLLAFVHVSTAFCHCDYEILEEKVYPSEYNPREIMEAVKWMDDKILNMITPKLLGQQPNCYTFSKRLTETLVQEYAHRIPVTIVRPSIVSPTVLEPMPGWVDNLNGPVGVMVAAGKGLIRSMLVEKNYHAEVIPVDIAINGVIVVARERARNPCNEETEIPVFNVTVGDLIRVTWGEVLVKAKKINEEYPLEAGLWYPRGTIRTNLVMHYFMVFLFQFIPAYFIDGVLYVCRQKTFLVRIQKRIFLGLKVMQYFTTREWHFKNDNGKALTWTLNKRDQDIFFMANVVPNVDQYLKDAILGARQYCMKEPLSSLGKARRQMKLLYWLDIFSQILVYGLIIWLLSYVLHLSDLYNKLVSLVNKI